MFLFRLVFLLGLCSSPSLSIDSSGIASPHFLQLHLCDFLALHLLLRFTFGLSLLFWFWLSHKTQQERLLPTQDMNDFSQDKTATLTLTDMTFTDKTRHSSVKFIFGFTLLLFLDLLCLDKTTSFL